MQCLQVPLIASGGIIVLSLSHGLGGLLLEVAVEELVVEEHAGDIGYLGVVDPVRGAIRRLCPAVREHQGMLCQVEPATEDGVMDPIAKDLDLVALERVVAVVEMMKFFDARSIDI